MFCPIVVRIFRFEKKVVSVFIYSSYIGIIACTLDPDSYYFYHFNSHTDSLDVFTYEYMTFETAVKWRLKLF